MSKKRESRPAAVTIKGTFDFSKLPEDHPGHGPRVTFNGAVKPNQAMPGSDFFRCYRFIVFGEPLDLPAKDRGVE